MKKSYLNETNLSLPEEWAHRFSFLSWINSAEKNLWNNNPPVAVSAMGRTRLSLFLFQRLTHLTNAVEDELLKELMIAQNPLLSFDLRLATQAESVRASTVLGQSLQENPEYLFQKAPILQNHITRSTNQFVDFIKEILLRVAENRKKIEAKFFNNEDFGEIIDWSCDNADLHFHGKSTMIVITEKGRFLYKPHDCRGDALYADLVKKLFPDITYAPQVILGDGFAFCEFIEANPIQHIDDVETYFHNLGGLSALFQALGSSDLHSENLLASGVFPVVTDLETILTPTPKVFNDTSIFPEAEADQESFIFDLNHSLLPSSLLPHLSGGEQTSVLLDERHNNLPILDGVKYPIWGFEQMFFEGFSKIYQRCIQHKDELLQELEGFRSVFIRRLIRNTNFYAQVQQRLLSPKALQDQQSQNDVVDSLSTYFTRHGAVHLVGIPKWEAQCLLEGDIPYFCVRGEGNDLLGYDQVVAPGFFKDSAVENAIQRIRRMSAQEHDFEISILRQSLDTAIIRLPTDQQRTTEETIPTAPLLTDKNLVEEAQVLFHRICDRAIESPCGAISWLSCVGDDGTFRPVRPGVFEGSTGMSLFFAAIKALSTDSETRIRADKFTQISLRDTYSLVDTLKNALRIPEELLPMGLASGLSGILKSLVLIARYSKNPEYIKLRDDALALLRPDMIENSTQLDVIGGVAGLLLTLCRYEELRETELGQMGIRSCADKLLATKNLSWKGDLALWDTIGRKRPISGLGHGMSGISAALLGAFTVLGREEYADAARDGLLFENRIFSERLGTWPDLRSGDSAKGFMHGFCSGAPGIGLALLACKESGANIYDVSQDLERAVDFTLKQGLLPRDHLCCGNSAAVDFLLEAGTKLNRHDLQVAARNMLSQMVARKNLHGEFTYLPTSFRSVFSISLFYGASGVGYELLRLADPSQIDSTLI